MTKILKTGLLVGVTLVAAVMLYTNVMQPNNKTALNDSDGMGDDLAITPVQIDNKPYQPKKVVSIPKPLTVATSKDLTPKAVLIQADASNQAEFMQSQSDNDDQSAFQVPQDVVNKITEQTGISQQDMQRAMTQEPN